MFYEDPHPRFPHNYVTNFTVTRLVLLLFRSNTDSNFLFVCLFETLTCRQCISKKCEMKSKRSPYPHLVEQRPTERQVDPWISTRIERGQQQEDHQNWVGIRRC